MSHPPQQLVEPLASPFPPPHFTSNNPIIIQHDVPQQHLSPPPPVSSSSRKRSTKSAASENDKEDAEQEDDDGDWEEGDEKNGKKKRKSGNWEKSEITYLLRMRREMRDEFDSCKSANSLHDVWTRLHSRIVSDYERTFSRSALQCEQKYNALLTRYKILKDAKSKTGEAAVQWEWAMVFDEICGENQNIRPTNVLDTSAAASFSKLSSSSSSSSKSLPSSSSSSSKLSTSSSMRSPSETPSSAISSSDDDDVTEVTPKKQSRRRITPLRIHKMQERDKQMLTFMTGLWKDVMKRSAEENQLDRDLMRELLGKTSE